jgi:hypothetical protein
MQYITSGPGGTFGVCFATLHGDSDVRDVWMDVILGTFGGDDPTDHVTFGCHVVATGSGDPVITAVDGAAVFAYRPIMGRRLTREQALSHERVDDFWRIVDLMLLSDPEVHSLIYA